MKSLRLWIILANFVSLLVGCTKANVDIALLDSNLGNIVFDQGQGLTFAETVPLDSQRKVKSQKILSGSCDKRSSKIEYRTTPDADWSELSSELSTCNKGYYQLTINDALIQLLPDTSSLVASQEFQFELRGVRNIEGGQIHSDISTLTLTLQLEQILPTVSITPPNSVYVNIENNTGFTISGNCSENDQEVSITGIDANQVQSIATSTLCTNKAWSKVIDFAAVIEGNITIQVDHQNANALKASTQSQTLIKDTLPPTSLILNAPQGVSSSKVLNVTAGSSGSNSSDSVVKYRYKLGLSADVDCSDLNLYSNPIAASTAITDSIESLADGAIKLCLLGLDNAGNAQTSTTPTIATWTKDTTAPTGTSIAINNNDASTASLTVGLNLSATGAFEMYITNSVGCSADGTWESFATTKSNWTLQQSNATNTVYAKFRDLAGNESSCIADAIDHIDNTPTNNSIAVNGNPTHVNTSTADLNLASTGAAFMYITNTADCGSGGTWEAFASTKVWPLNLNQTNNIYAKFKSATNEISACVSTSVVHDNLAPIGASIEVSSGNSYTNSTAVTLNLAVSEASAQYVTNTAACTSGGSWESISTTKPWTLGATEGNQTVYVKFKDLAGNETSCLSDSIVYDNTAPTPPSAIDDGSFFSSTTSSPPITFTLGSDSGSGLNFHEARVIKASDSSEVKSYSTISSGSSIGGLTLTNGESYKVQIRAVDLAGFISTVATSDGWTVDNGVPAVTLSTAAPLLTNSSSITVDVTFSKNVTGLDLSDFTLTNATAANLTGVGMSYSFTLIPSTQGSFSVSLPAASAQDSAANGNTVSNTLTLNFDNQGPISPSLVINSNDNYTATTVANLALSASDADQMYLTNNSDCSSGGAWESYVTTKTWSLSQTNTTATVYVKYRDAAGNLSTCASDTIVHDNISPTVTATLAVATSPVNVANKVVNINFSEPVMGFISTDLTLTNATLIGFTEISSTQWNVEISATANGLASLLVPGGAVTDLASNNNSASNTVSYTFDNVKPVVTLSKSNSSSPNNANPMTITATFDEAVTSFDIFSLATSNASISNFTSVNSFTYTFDVTPTTDGVVGVMVLADTATDSAGNKVIQTQISYTFDGTAPTAPTISINSGASFTNTTSVNLSLGVNGATMMYITNLSSCVGGGTWEAFTTTKNWDLTTANATNNVYVKYKDDAGNTSSCVSDSIEHDGNPPGQPTLALGGYIMGEAMPSITVSNLVIGNSVQLFANNTCDGTSLSSVIVADAASKNISTSGLAIGVNNIYAKVSEPSGMTTCSGTFVSYTLLNHLTVTPAYPNNANWNSYVKFSDNTKSIFNQADTACDAGSLDYMDQYGGCFHSGEIRSFTVNGITSCQNLMVSDLLDIFDWVCDQSSLPIRFYSKGLKPGKGLRDVISGSSGPGQFRINGVRLFHQGTQVSTSDNGTWWNNVISELPPSRGPTDATFESLYTPETIYYTALNKEYTNLSINASKIAVVTLGSATVKYNRAQTSTNCTTNGLPSTGGGLRSLFCTKDQKHLWLEGNFDGTGAGIQPSSETFIVSYNTSHSKFINLNLTNFYYASANNAAFYLGGLSSSSCVGNRFENLKIYKAVAGFNFVNNCSRNILRKIYIGNITGNSDGGYGINLTNSSNNNRLVEIKINSLNSSGTVTGVNGIQISNSSYNVLNQVVVSNVNDNSLSINESNGIWLNSGATNNVLTDITVANTMNGGIAFHSGSITNNIVKNVTVVSTQFNGINIASPSFSNNFIQNVAIANSDKGYKATAMGTANVIRDFISANNSTVDFIPASAGETTVYTGFMRGGSSPTTFDGVTGSAITGASSIVTSATSNLSLAFKGAINIDDSVNTFDSAGSTSLSAFTSIDPMVMFESFYRLWGNVASGYFATKGYSGTSLKIWDLRTPSSTALQNKSVDGMISNSDPGISSGGSIPTCMGPLLKANAQSHAGITFMLYATEVMNDSLGNENGLCESNEACLYSPNVGAYQGEGDYQSAGACNTGVGTAGEVSNAIIYKYLNSGI